MKIVHLIQRYAPAIGGCEQWCQQISRYLVKQEHQVNVLTMQVYHEEEFFTDLSFDRRTAVLGKRDSDQGVLIHRYPRTKIHPWFHRFFLEGLLDKKLGIYFYGPHSLSMYLAIPIQIYDTDVVHLHGMHYPHNLIGFFWAKLLRKKIVMIPHFHPGHPFYERHSHYWLMRHCDAILAVSDIEKDYLIKKGIEKHKILTVGNSINLDEYQPKALQQYKNQFYNRYQIQDREKIVTFVGRKIEYKGIDHLIEAILKLNQRGQTIRLFMVGPSFEWFDKFYSQLTSQQRESIVDLGVVSQQEKVNLLYLSQMVVLASQYEAFGIVLLEAWACNTPVVGTNEGAMAWLIDGGGKTVPYGDVEKLSQAIEFLISDPDQARTMAKNGKEKLVNHYTQEKVGEKVEGIYRELITAC